jgi:hypothetical protein
MSSSRKWNSDVNSWIKKWLRSMRWLGIRICMMATMGLAVVAGVAARADDESTKALAEPKTLREYIDTASTSWYEVFPNAEAKEPAKVLATLRWANNVRGSDDGVTVLFVHDGVPLSAACVFPWRKRLYHCFESLSRDKIVARHEGTVIWEPQEPGVKFVDFPDAPAVEESRPARLRQMKAFAERFQANMTVKTADSTNREELRLLPRPLFRYEPKSETVIDGAVFAFVMGTDPEVLLQVEAVLVDGKNTWQYAFARRTFCRLECTLDKTVVWDVAQYPDQDDPKRPHYTRGVPLPPDIAAEQARLEATKR